MKVLLLLAFCTEEDELFLLENSKCGLQNSIIAFQRKMIQGFSTLCPDLDVLYYYPVGSFPKYNKRFFYNSSQSIIDKMSFRRIGFINLPVVKQVYLNTVVNKAVKKWIHENQSQDKAIITYDLLRPHLKALSKIGKKEIVNTCSIIADLPNEFGYQKKFGAIKSIVMRAIGENNLILSQRLSCFGLLTQQMRLPLHIGDNYVVIEGFSDPERYYTYSADNSLKKIILYTGALYSIYGLDSLLKAFEQIDDENYELWLCGVGDFVSTILLTAKTNKRVKYLGYKSQNEIAYLQSKATVLINPRKNDGEYTKYSFPSKIIEYLSAARPVIAYKLDGISDDYYKYLTCPKDNSIEALKDVIISVCELPYERRCQLGKEGREFIINRTSPQIQCLKILELIKKI